MQLRAAWLHALNVQIELLQYGYPATRAATSRRAAGGPRYAVLVFEVSSLRAAAAHRHECGGRRLDDPTADRGADPGFAQRTDLDGIAVGLLELYSPATRAAPFQHLPEPFIRHRFETARSALKQHS